MAIAFGGTRANMKIGNMRYTFNSVDLGYTDELEVNFENEWYERMGDQTGSTILDMILSGQKSSLTVMIKEFTVANINKVMLGGTLAVNLFEWGGSLAGGLAALTSAATITLHPLDVDDATLTSDHNFFKAAPIAIAGVKMTSKGDQVLPVTFRVLGDTAKARGKQHYSYGA